MWLGTYTSLRKTTFDHCKQKFTKSDKKGRKSSKNRTYNVTTSRIHDFSGGMFGHTQLNAST